MDKIGKFLRKLNKKEFEAFFLLINQIKRNHKKVPGLRKLAGKKNSYRVRLGKYRIIFKIAKGEAKIVRITKRDDQTYKNL